MPQLPVFIPQGTTGVKPPGRTFQQWAEAASDPTTPGTGEWLLYFKSGGLYVKDDAGSVTGPLSTGGGGGVSKDYGCNISNNGADASHDIDIAAGYRYNVADSLAMKLTSDVTREIDGTFGTGNGGLFSGASLSAGATLYLFLIEKDSDNSIDVGIDTSATAANIPAGYSNPYLFARVLLDASSNVRPFTQTGDFFRWTSQQNDLNAAISQGTAAVTRDVTVPEGDGVTHYGRFALFWSGGTAYLVVNATTDVDNAASATNSHLGTNTNARWPQIQLFTPTNSSAQIRTRADQSAVNVFHYIATDGWRDALYQGVVTNGG